jgi:hypothetical protein
LHDHNGRGAWPSGSAEPLRAARHRVKPWRDGGTKILVCAQRGIGSPGRASPPGWAEKVAAGDPQDPRRARSSSGASGRQRSAIPLEQDLAGAAACVIWASGAGVKALSRASRCSTPALVGLQRRRAAL